MGQQEREREFRVLTGEEQTFVAKRRAQRLIASIHDFANDPHLGGLEQVRSIVDRIFLANWKQEGGC